MKLLLASRDVNVAYTLIYVSANYSARCMPTDVRVESRFLFRF